MSISWLAGYNIREQGTVGLPPDPGYNALQTASISGYIGGGTLANAPEHNYRDGGPASGERITRDLTIQGMTSKNAGQCCFKMFTGVDTTGYYRNITLANISAFNPRARAGAGGFNDFGFMLQQMVDSRAHGLSCIVEGGNPKAGMYVSGADNLQIDGYQFRQSSGIAASNAIWISEYNGDATGAPQACNGLGIKNIYAQGHSAEGVRLEFPSASIRDMYLAGQIIAGTDGIGPAPAAARFAQLSRFELLVRGNSGTKFNLPVTANVVNKDLTTP
ncbi:hypothetical protein KEM44_21185 [Sinorhizobium meliloti]|nr:hypothetical protein KEM44_21185 [Sinorhizobium meliloti]